MGRFSRVCLVTFSLTLLSLYVAGLPTESDSDQWLESQVTFSAPSGFVLANPNTIKAAFSDGNTLILRKRGYSLTIDGGCYRKIVAACFRSNGHSQFSAFNCGSQGCQLKLEATALSPEHPTGEGSAGPHCLGTDTYNRNEQPYRTTACSKTRNVFKWDPEHRAIRDTAFSSFSAFMTMRSNDVNSNAEVYNDPDDDAVRGWEVWFKKPAAFAQKILRSEWQRVTNGFEGTYSQIISNKESVSENRAAFEYQRRDTAKLTAKLTGGGLFSPPTGFRADAKYTSDRWFSGVSTSVTRTQFSSKTYNCRAPAKGEWGMSWNFVVESQTAPEQFNKFITDVVCTYAPMSEIQAPVPQCPPLHCGPEFRNCRAETCMTD